MTSRFSAAGGGGKMRVASPSIYLSSISRPPHEHFSPVPPRRRNEAKCCSSVRRLAHPPHGSAYRSSRTGWPSPVTRFVASGA